MRRWKAAALVAFFGFAQTGSAVAQEPEAERASAQAGQGQKAAVASATQVAAPILQITTDTDIQIAGVLSRVPLRVGFSSRMDRASHVILRLELGDIVLDAEADFQEDTRTLDGHSHAYLFSARGGT